MTMQLGSISLETAHRCVTLLDAPGHRDFEGAMIAGGLRADAGILVVSAQKGEFEAGWSAAGLTKEHLLVMVGGGLGTLAIVVNKMDTVRCRTRAEVVRLRAGALRGDPGRHRALSQTPRVQAEERRVHPRVGHRGRQSHVCRRAENALVPRSFSHRVFG